MARYSALGIGEKLKAAEEWRDRCLLHDGSVFTDESIWTLAHLDELDRFFIQDIREDDRSFYDKLEEQLRPASAGAKKLAAEMLWVMLLFPKNISLERKQTDIARVWSWSGETLPPEHRFLSDALGGGGAAAGTGFNTHRWRELAFFIRMLQDWKRLDHAERERLLADPWAMNEWVYTVREEGFRQLPHMLLYLLFPDYFERSVTGYHKRAIVRAFAGKLPNPELLGEVDEASPPAINRALYDIRKRLETEHPGEEVDFYQDRFRRLWDESGDKQRYWKIAPGEQGHLWAQWRDGEFIAIGWGELGDISGLSHTAFGERCDALLAKHPNWTRSRLDQVWRFAHIAEGDRVVANRGTTEVLGIGTVTGPYEFVEGVPYGHRLPVRWDDAQPRSVNQGGWRKTLIELDEATFNEIAGSKIGSGNSARPVRVWVEKTIVKGRTDREQGPLRVGQALWSPQTAKGGQRIYDAMTKALPGDIVLHLTDNNAITAASRIDAAADDTFVGPEHTEWGGRPGFLIRLRDYVRLDPELPRAAFLDDASLRPRLEDIATRHSGLFYNRHRGLNQGAYLTEAPPELVRALDDAYRGVSGRHLPYLSETGLIGEKHHWIFQANPRLYDIDAALAELETMTWSARQHATEIQPGDIAYIWRAGKEAGIVGKLEITEAAAERDEPPEVARFTKDTERLPARDNRVVCRVLSRVEPILSAEELRNTPELRDLSILRYHQGTNFPVTDGEAVALDRLLAVRESREVLAERYTVADFATETGFAEAQIASWLARLRRKKHIVIQGPPGTGKTFVAQRLARCLISETTGRADLVQFHPSYAYEDFMQGIRPEVASGGQLAFRVTPGRFLEFCQKANERPDAPCVLIIDEINRANLSRVFGELMYLLEYRDAEVPLSTSGEPFQVPSNVFLIGTMNTADRSIALVDHALRRRFSFVFLGPEYDLLATKLREQGLPAESLVNVLREVNAAIDDRHYEVGISFFLADGPNLRHTLPMIWESEIEPYLEEYFYDQPSNVEEFRWSKLAAGKLAEWV
jgi:MoxR-like ATPase